MRRARLQPVLAPAVLAGLLIAALPAHLACPSCPHDVRAAIQVELLEYPCEFSDPDSRCRARPPADPGVYTVSYSRDGGPYLPCDGLLCDQATGEAGACEGGDFRSGSYRVRVEGTGRTWTSEPLDVAEECGVAIQEFWQALLMDAPPPAACKMASFQVQPVAGTLTWTSGGEETTLSFPDPAGGGATLLVKALQWLDEDGVPALRLSAYVVATVTRDGWTLGWTSESGGLGSDYFDPRDPVGSSWSSLPEVSCSHDGSSMSWQHLDVESTIRLQEGAGGAAAWPAIVSPDFRRRIRVISESPDLRTVERRSSFCCSSACTPAPSLRLDLTFELGPHDFQLDPTGDCATERRAP